MSPLIGISESWRLIGFFSRFSPKRQNLCGIFYQHCFAHGQKKLFQYLVMWLEMEQITVTFLNPDCMVRQAHFRIRIRLFKKILNKICLYLVIATSIFLEVFTLKSMYPIFLYYFFKISHSVFMKIILPTALLLSFWIYSLCWKSLIYRLNVRDSARLSSNDSIQSAEEICDLLENSASIIFVEGFWRKLGNLCLDLYKVLLF